ncbi:MAG: hypothetical protein U9O98_04880 [Asgard group archaeon]|nr:hypothetical protein [Asgard group archaeon]
MTASLEKTDNAKNSKIWILYGLLLFDVLSLILLAIFLPKNYLAYILVFSLAIFFLLLGLLTGILFDKERQKDYFVIKKLKNTENKKPHQNTNKNIKSINKHDSTTEQSERIPLKVFRRNVIFVILLIIFQNILTIGLFIWSVLINIVWFQIVSGFTVILLAFIGSFSLILSYKPYKRQKEQINKIKSN